MRLRAAALSLLLLGFAGGVSAADLDYDYLLLQYNHDYFSEDSFFTSGKAYTVGARYGLPADFVAAGSYNHGRFDNSSPFLGAETDDTLSVGLLYHYALSSRIDLLPSFYLQSSRLSFPGSLPGYPQTVNGHSLGLGLRGFFTDELEFEAGVAHATTGGASSSAYFGVTYDFGGKFGLGADLNRSVVLAQQDQYSTSLDLFARFYF